MYKLEVKNETRSRFPGFLLLDIIEDYMGEGGIDYKNSRVAVQAFTGYYEDLALNEKDKNKIIPMRIVCKEPSKSGVSIVNFDISNSGLVREIEISGHSQKNTYGLQFALDYLYNPDKED